MSNYFKRPRINLKVRSAVFKTWLSVADLIKQYREEARAKYHAEVSQELETKRGEGLYPFEGKWRTIEEITKLQKLMKHKDITIFVDLIILFLIIIFSSFMGLVFLFTFLYKQ